MVRADRQCWYESSVTPAAILWLEAAREHGMTAASGAHSRGPYVLTGALLGGTIAAAMEGSKVARHCGTDCWFAAGIPNIAAAAALGAVGGAIVGWVIHDVTNLRRAEHR